jgi:NAD(P)-dependent dehydrogenase (short-subunit alcohol dehydrogenase family)
MPPSRDRTPDSPAAAPPLGGRTVLVTGGAHRVGQAITRELAARGARVVVHHHASEEAARALAAELPHGALPLAADLAAADGPGRLLAACAAAGALPDAVIHSAASFLRRPVLDTSAEEWDEVFALNLRAFFLLARDFARRHAAAGEGSAEGAAGGDRCLVAISDSGAYELWIGYAAHCVAKAALLPLVRVLAKALAPAVRVNAVVPGPVLPEPGASPERRRAIERRTLLGRIGEPADVARAVAFLLENRFTTGTVLEVTGGAHLWRGRLDRD